MWYMYIVEYYSTIKKNETLVSCSIVDGREDLLIEIRQTDATCS
jgi:hypothetical protein